MRYFPLSENGGLILDANDLPLTIVHDPETEVMTWRFGQGKPTIFNREAAERWIKIIEDYPEWIHVKHPVNIAARYNLINLPAHSAKRRKAEELEASPLLDNMLAIGWETLLKATDEPKPITGIAENGEPI